MSFEELFCGTVHFSGRWYDIKNRMQKYHVLPNLTVQSHKLKKLQRDERINLEIIAYLLIKLPELFRAILILCLSGWHFFKDRKKW